MKPVWCVLVAVAALGALGMAALISQDAAIVSSVLAELKFEETPNKTKLIGAPPKFTITKKTLEHLAKLMKEGQVIEVQPDGTLKTVKAK